MADVIARSFVNLRGWTGAPGVNVVHWVPRLSFPADVGDYTPAMAASFLAALRTAYQGLTGAFASGYYADFPAEVSLIEATTGQLVGAVVASSTPNAAGPGGGDGDVSRASQGIMSLQTSNYIAGRRIQGRLFLGPLGRQAFDSDGTLTTSLIGSANSAFGALLSGGSSDGQLVVWHRPKPGVSAGASCAVTAVAMREKPGVLRSRRD